MLNLGVNRGLSKGINPVKYPQNLTQWVAAGLPSIDSLWRFDEASGNFLDRAGSHDFVVTAGSVTRRVLTPYGYGIRLDSEDAALTVTSTAFMDGGTATDLSAFILAQPPAQTAIDRTLIGKRGGTGFPGWAVFSNGTVDKTARVIIDGDTQHDIPTIAIDHGGVLAGYVATLEWGVGAFFDTTLGSASDESLSVSDISTTSPLSVGAGVNNTEPGTIILFAAVKEGYAWTAEERKTLVNYFG